MATGRFIDKGISVNARVNGMSRDAAFVFTWAIPHCDRDGLIEGDRRVLFAKICPMQEDLRARMDDIVQEWKDSGLVIEYEYREGTVLWFTGFHEHQKLSRYEKEAPSRFPKPPGFLVDDCPQPAEQVRQPSGNDPKPSGKKPPTPATEPRPSRQPTPANVIASAEPATRSVTMKSRFLDARHFVDGYIPSNQGKNAVEVYYERFSINNDAARLNVIKEDDLARGCPDLDRLREVITAYSRTTFKPGNIQLILDWYANGVPDARQASAKSTGRTAGKSDRNMAVIDEFERAYGDMEIVPAFAKVGSIAQ